MTIKSEQQVAAEHLRRQKASSTDPDRLEREARRIEGCKHGPKHRSDSNAGFVCLLCGEFIPDKAP